MRTLLRMYYENEKVFKAIVTIMILALVVNTQVDRSIRNSDFERVERKREDGDSTTLAEMQSMRRDLTARIDTLSHMAAGMRAGVGLLMDDHTDATTLRMMYQILYELEALKEQRTIGVWTDETESDDPGAANAPSEENRPRVQHNGQTSTLKKMKVD